MRGYFHVLGVTRLLVNHSLSVGLLIQVRALILFGFFANSTTSLKLVLLMNCHSHQGDVKRGLPLLTSEQRMHPTMVWTITLRYLETCATFIHSHSEGRGQGASIGCKIFTLCPLELWFLGNLESSNDDSSATVVHVTYFAMTYLCYIRKKMIFCLFWRH